jgi:hypothetical protein
MPMEIFPHPEVEANLRDERKELHLLKGFDDMVIDWHKNVYRQSTF